MTCDLPPGGHWKQQMLLNMVKLRYGDLSGHANNTSFVEWAIEAVPDEIWNSCDLIDLDIQFLAECHQGQIVSSHRQLLSDGDTREVRHQLVRAEDGAEVARARSGWGRTDRL